MRDVIEQLLLPAECFECHALLAPRHSGDLICPLCRSRWRRVVPPWCERCGQPEPWFGTCRLCAAWPRAFRWARSAVWLDPAARRAVHALKYRGLPRLADALASALERIPLPGSRAHPDGGRRSGGVCLVPVPLGPRRLAARGYNQSDRLARSLHCRWGFPVLDLLVRVRETRTQTALTPAARLANVAGAFAVRNAESGARNADPPFHSAFRIPHSTLLVLVDDVFTTGATLAAAACALEAAGARAIAAVTFGRATIPDFT